MNERMGEDDTAEFSHAAKNWLVSIARRIEFRGWISDVKAPHPSLSRQGEGFLVPHP